MPQRDLYPVPYVKRDPSEGASVLRGRVREYGAHYVDFWLTRLRAADMAATLDFLDSDSPVLALNRIVAMLENLQKHLSASSKPCLADLHTPIVFAAPGGTEVAASSVLIAVSAILYSHTAWTQSEFHDIRSALRAQELLDRQGISGALVDRITLLVSLQNVVRTAVIPMKEVGVWNGSAIVTDDDSIAACLATVLAHCKATEPWFCSALLLVAGAYEARLGKQVSWDLFERFGALLKMRVVGAAEGESTGGTLIALEFGKYLFPEPADRKKCMADIAGSGSFPASAPPPLFWVALGRYWGTHHQLPPAVLATIPAHLVAYPSSQFPRCFIGLASTPSHGFWRLELTGDTWFQFIFGTAPQFKPNTKIWDLVAQQCERFVGRRANSRYPEVFVSRLLEDLYHCYPELMAKLDLWGSDGDRRLSASTSLYAPLQAPEIRELEAAVEKSRWGDPKLLVARCAAGAVANRDIGRGDLARTITCIDPRADVRKWMDIIDWVARRNAHNALTDYVRKYRAAPPDRLYAPPSPRWSAQSQDTPARENALVLGVDVGAGDVKAALYRLSSTSEGRWQLSLVCQHKGFKTQARAPYANADRFVEYVLGQLDSHADWACSDWSSRDHRLVAVGVTWPGAVAGPAGREYVAANSAAINIFRDFPPPEHWKYSAEEIRRLALHEAFERGFTGPDGRCPVVRLINDGVAHVLSERAQLEVFAGGTGALAPGELIVGLTAGTGSAMAVLLEDGTLLNGILAELGRLITHIGDPFPPPSPAAYPVGTGRDAFNKATLGRVATRLLLEAMDLAPSDIATISRELSATMTSLSDAFRGLDVVSGRLSPKSPSHARLDAAKRELAFAAAGLPLVPSLLIGWILEDDLVRKERLESYWAAERPAAVTASLADLSSTLSRFLAGSNSKEEWVANAKEFALGVAQRAGTELADLIASTTNLFGATNVIVGGGPLSDKTGEYLRHYAREELEKTYRFEVLRNPPPPDKALPPRLSRLLRFPEPSAASEEKGPSGAYGAALAAVDLLPPPAEPVGKA